MKKILAFLLLSAATSFAQTVTNPYGGNGYVLPGPTAAAPADDESNATAVSRVGTFTYVFDGSAWDRWTGVVSATQSGTWNVGTVSTITNPVSVTGSFWPTTAASPLSARLSDGSAFYDGAKTGQFPSALVSGRFDVNIGASSATVPVSGTFWQTTQPVSSTQLPAALAANGGLKIEGVASGVAVPVSGSFWPTTAGSHGSQRLSDGSAFYDATKTGQLPTALDGSGFLKVHEQGTAAVSGTFWPTTAASPSSARLSDGSAFYDAAKTGQLPSALVSGRLDVNIGAASATNISTNVAQFGGTNISTGVGAGGAGIPRVTLSNDSTLAANQSVNVNQIAGSSVSTAAAGVQKVGVVGSAGAALDAANNAAAPANVVAIGAEARSSGPTQNSNGNVARLSADLAGNLAVAFPLRWTCAKDAIAASLTECQVAAPSGYSYYITSVFAISTTTTAATFAIRSGTGTNCGTSTAGVLPGASTSRTYTLPASTAAPFQFSSDIGVKVTAANAVCVIGAATNTLNIVISGYTAP